MKFSSHFIDCHARNCKALIFCNIVKKVNSAKKFCRQFFLYFCLFLFVMILIHDQKTSHFLRNFLDELSVQTALNKIQALLSVSPCSRVRWKHIIKIASGKIRKTRLSALSMIDYVASLSLFSLSFTLTKQK